MGHFSLVFALRNNKKAKDMSTILLYLMERFTKWAIQFVWTVFCEIIRIILLFACTMLQRIVMWVRISLSVPVAIFMMLITYFQECQVKRSLETNLNIR